MSLRKALEEMERAEAYQGNGKIRFDLMWEAMYRCVKLIAAELLRRKSRSPNVYEREHHG